MQVRLFQAENYLQARMLKGLLAHQGIDTFIKGESLLGALGELPVDAGQMEIWVEQCDLALARQLLEEFQARSNQNLDWFCSQCGEKNASSFDWCWQCQTEQPKAL